MPDTPYQNIDISQNNPLGFKEETPSSSPETTSKKLSPKVIFLIVLGMIIFLLLVVSLVVTSRRKKETLAPPEITPSPVEIVVPTTSKSLLPEIYREKFNIIENNLNDDLKIEVPAIDLEIGL